MLCYGITQHNGFEGRYAREHNGFGPALYPSITILGGVMLFGPQLFYRKLVTGEHNA